MNLNNTETETFRQLKQLPFNQLLDRVVEELKPDDWFQYRKGRMEPVLKLWRLIRRYGWTKEEFMRQYGFRR
jgi:hypothetical protein